MNILEKGKDGPEKEKDTQLYLYGLSEILYLLYKCEKEDDVAVCCRLMGSDWDEWWYTEGWPPLLWVSDLLILGLGRASLTAAADEVLWLADDEELFCCIIQTARWWSRVAPLAASSSGSRKWESRPGVAVLLEDTVDVSGDWFDEISGEAGHDNEEEVEVILGGNGTWIKIVGKK